MTDRFDWAGAIGDTFTELANQFFPNTVTFYSGTDSRSPTGVPTRTNWQPVAGLTDIPALIQSPAVAQGQAGGGDILLLTSNARATLPFFTTALDTKMRMKDERGVEYEVDGWEYDPAKVSTVVTIKYRGQKGEHV